MKAIVKLVEEYGKNPKYMVYSVPDEGTELFVDLFLYGYEFPEDDDIWGKNQALSKAMELAKTIEVGCSEKKVSVIYETKP